MSKGSLFWGKGRGKLGETVFYRAGGEQRNRTYVKNIRNPKTVAQMTQRILTLNPISMFKGLKPVVSESFTERKANQSSYNKFVQENSSMKKFFITKAMLEQQMCVPYGAVISKGSLGLNLEPQIAMVSDGVAENGYAVFDCIFDAQKLTDFSGLTDTGSNALTGATLVRVMRQTAIVDLPTKFSVVIVEAVPQEFELESGDIVNPWKLAYHVINVDGDSYTERVYGCEGTSLNGTLYLLPEDMEARPSAENKGLHIGLNLNTIAPEEAILHPCGIILSFVENGELKVSNSVITSNYKNVGTTPVRGVVNAFLEGNEVYQESMNQYGYSTGGTLNAQSLVTPVAMATINFIGNYEDLLVNGNPAANGEFPVGSAITFSSDQEKAITVTLQSTGDVIASQIESGRSASWVVPNVESVTLNCVQELS